ncbi:MAG TPA: hypothetical protein VG537_04180, partial [Candidatus Kapabacteria bacterium]|nr:hypothetical protein [Candidatus Kapabacteria bacterium]
TAMPAFHTRNKGPLGDEEIASLIEYMSAFKKAAQQTNTIKSLGPTKTTGAVLKAPAGKGEAAVTPAPKN